MVRPTALQDRSLQWPPRPAGELLWVHASTTERYMALCDVGHRLKSLRPDLSILVSWGPEITTRPKIEGCDLAVGAPPEDTPSDVRLFLDHWRPDLCIWSGGDLRRVLMRQLAERQIDTLLVDITPKELPERTSRWLPDQRRRMLDRFTEILTPSHEAEARLLRIGVARDKLTLSDPLRLSATPPGCNNDELVHMQSILGSRPIWFSSDTDLQDLYTILNAHRSVLKLLHRLLLVVAMRDEDDLAEARDAIQHSGLQLADWDSGEEPDDYTQVLLCSSEDSGLWYRLAPLSLLAGSLARGNGGQNPLDAAALGSAILHGPGLGTHHAAYKRLHDAGAALEVDGVEGLAQGVLSLSAPDRAAEMALAGWDIVTEGAGMTDHLLELIQDLLDRREDRYESS
ncbi:MAG: 3-deoxy-D-manno-octulosonic acid transferase [Phaeobacter italicus]|nr:glycosyltransferase N-terminal domain-containing protein [Phaeobacter italicus]MEC8015895.1 glycosyltransferase N-terminal domain-containing protein [Pseudomonadota bacterium]MBO9443517.1 3-deoxy-D-manno-octulosonic acid transferase [Phaeobacter italicus]MBY5977806.1 3-deoxy-D-manno-octulosonic acid transferase [Phaeobacter italicus]MBY6045156.1 3-deoxy-D-manno-octulosonic acid transferase [Phaeobacter italicus]MCI5098742.1 3-deoxy-D-manno-octulosonic acid transferase [Phaeobacter italicus]